MRPTIATRENLKYVLVSSLGSALKLSISPEVPVFVSRLASRFAAGPTQKAPFPGGGREPLWPLPSPG